MNKKTREIIKEIVLYLGNLAEYELCLFEARKRCNDLNCKYDIKIIKNLSKIKDLDDFKKVLKLINISTNVLKDFIYDKIEESFIDEVDMNLSELFLEPTQNDIFPKTHKLLNKFISIIKPFNITGKYIVQFERLGNFVVYVSNSLDDAEEFAKEINCSSLGVMENDDISIICNF